MSTRKLATLALALTLVLAGCNGPASHTGPKEPTSATVVPTSVTTESTTTKPITERTPTGTSESTATGDSSVTVVRGGFPFDPNTTWQRVNSLLGVDPVPPQVIATSPAETPAQPISIAGDFGERLGVGNASFDETGPAAGGSARGNGRTVMVIFGNETPSSSIESTLAHEFVHVAQYHRESPRAIHEAQWENRTRTLDSVLTSRALIEGGALYVEDRYRGRYLDGESTMDSVERRYENASTGMRLFLGFYRYGAAHVQTRIDQPADLWQVYENPPTTTEQVLHPSSQDEPVTLSVSVAENTSWSTITTDSKGEFYVRELLAGQLDSDTAEQAAAGWGNDRVLRLDNGSTSAYVWALRWDTDRDAEEALSAFREFASQQQVETTLSVERVGDRTIVLTLGPESFTTEDDVAVTGNGTVTVTPGASAN